MLRCILCCVHAVVLMLMLPLCCFAAGDNLMTDVIYLEPVTVSGEAEAENLNTSTLRVEEKSRSNNIADYLFNDTEISFKRKSNIGDSGDVISIRGFESKRIMLNLDGRAISSTGIAGEIISTSAPSPWTISNGLRSSRAAVPLNTATMRLAALSTPIPRPRPKIPVSISTPPPAAGTMSTIFTTSGPPLPRSGRVSA